MDPQVQNNVDYRLLQGLSNLVICSHCLKAGKVTPVPQIISKRRRPSSLCADCRRSRPRAAGLRRKGKILPFPF